jgi:hypothetical protein
MLFVAGAPVRYLTRLVGGAGILVVFILVDVLYAPPNTRLSSKIIRSGA